MVQKTKLCRHQVWCRVTRLVLRTGLNSWCIFCRCLIQRQNQIQTSVTYDLIHQHWRNFHLEKQVLKLSYSHPPRTWRNWFIACVYYLMAEPEAQHHGHSVQTGRAFPGSPTPFPEQAQGIILWGLETLQGQYTTTYLGLSPLPSHPWGGKAFPYLQPPWLCSVCCPRGLRTFSSDLPPGLVSLLPGWCPSGVGVDSVLTQITWRLWHPLSPNGPSPSAQWFCPQEHRLGHPSLGSPANMTGIHLVTSHGHYWEAAVGHHFFRASR